MSVVFLAALFAAAPPVSAEPQQPEEKLICERQVETGSRLKGKKVCKTKRQWEIDAAEARRAVRDGLTGGFQTK